MRCAECNKEISDDEWVVNWTSCSECFDKHYEEYLQSQKENTMPIDKPYAYHKPSPKGLYQINQLREAFSEMEKLIHEMCPESRQRAVAITNLETTAMWAIKAVVFNDPDSVADIG